jgi:hypothetical protein
MLIFLAFLRLHRTKNEVSLYVQFIFLGDYYLVDVSPLKILLANYV